MRNPLASGGGSLTGRPFLRAASVSTEPRLQGDEAYADTASQRRQRSPETLPPYVTDELVLTELVLVVAQIDHGGPERYHDPDRADDGGGDHQQVSVHGHSPPLSLPAIAELCAFLRSLTFA